jgi:outer membrane protein assembly factor BamB
VGSWDEKLHAINPNGTEKWNFTTGQLVNSSPTIGADGTIYISSNDLHAINPDGTQKWSLTIGLISSSAAIGSNGTIYIGSGDYNIYAINPNGTEKWNFTTGNQVLSSPAIGSDGTIYVGSNDYKLYAINPDGTEKWNFTTGNGVKSSPAIGSDGTIYVGSMDHNLYAINPDGSEKWNFTTGDYIYKSSPTISFEGTIYIGSGDDKLYAINQDGSEKWNFTTGNDVVSSPAIGSDGTIYVGSADSKLYAIGPQNLKVNVTSHFTTLNSAAQSTITVQVTNGTNPIRGAIINLTTDNGGFFSPQSGITDLNGNFTSIFNTLTVTTQIICRITAEVNKSGYNNGSGYVDVTIIPIPWPMFRHNLRHTGLSPYDTSTNPGKLKWLFPTAGPVESSPAIGSDGTIYVGSDDNKLYAIYPDSTEKWSFETGNGIWSSPTIDSDGTIYVGSMDNKLYAINPDGTEKWSFTTGDGVYSSPAIGSEGTIYVGSRDKRLYAINPNGSEKWNFETGHWIWSSPTIGSDGTIYVGSYDDKLYAINPNGTEKWSFKTGFGIWSSPTIGSDRTIYLGSYDNKLYAINPDGTEKWSFTTGDGVYSSPAIGMDGTIYFGSDDHKLYAINPDGSEKWNFMTGSYILPSPTIGSDGSIYIGSCDNRFYAINPDGSEKWNLTTYDHVHSSPAIDPDGTIYVGSWDNNLYAIGKADIPPTLYINISQDGEDAILYWDRSTSQTDFDFNTVWVNTSEDNESGEPGPIPLRTMWNDTNAALPSNVTNYQEQYYYTIRAVDVLGGISTTSRTVGKWTKSFPQGVLTFSLPLEPLGSFDTEWYTSNMNADYIKYMNTTTHTWMQHNFGDGTKNNTQMKLGEGYEVKFSNKTNFTFTGMPGAMIKYKTDVFIGFDYNTNAKNLSAIVDPVTGNVTLTWNQPSSMDGDDSYEVFRSLTRDGFNDGTAVLLDILPYGNETYVDPGATLLFDQCYYMIIPVNETGIEGATTYSIGIWTEEYTSGYDTFGIPLKLNYFQTADWYCDNIVGTVGINYYIHSEQRWSWHSTRMPAGAYDPDVVMAEGYQISTITSTKYSFIGI